ncbi:MAG: phosphoribosylglycinamide formyltransferase [Candidatus Micrarchaeota archaeon]|nr:phosphoribosylglycinamide formyltransferase [Candidatus Micrarchaeota archaeon]
MKDAIRKEMIKKRDEHYKQKGHRLCLAIMDRFLRLPEFEKAGCVLLYASKGSEVHTSDIIRSALSLGKKVVLPVTNLEKHELELYQIGSIEELVPGAFGIPEPPRAERKRVSPQEIELAVIPGISFDMRGYRIGYGKGYYDKLLPQIKGKKVGLAYEIQIMDKIPNEAHDIAVDIIVTEERVIRCNKDFRVVVLASGRGSDFQSIIDGIKSGKVHASVVGLITDNPNAYAIKRAQEAGIPYFVIPHSSREELDRGILEKLDELSPDLVVLAGYMKIIKSKELLSKYAGRIINIHPSLLPKYPGMNAQKAAFEAGEKISGYTIHFVDETLDGGKIIYQEKVDISDCKSAEEVAAKILEREHVGLPMIVEKFARGEIKPEDMFSR